MNKTTYYILLGIRSEIELILLDHGEEAPPELKHLNEGIQKMIDEFLLNE